MNDLAMSDLAMSEPARSDAGEALPAGSDFMARRQTMVERQVRTFGVVDGAVLQRMLDIPRELFLPAERVALAYSDAPIALPTSTPGAESRVLLPPMLLARMIEAASLRAGDRILDLAGATGYSAALLAGLGREVVSIDDESSFARSANANFAALGLVNARADTASLDQPGAIGLFDAILVNGAIEANFEPLFDLMADNGRLVAVLKSGTDRIGGASRAVLYEKLNGRIGWRDLFDATAPVLPPFRARPRFAL